MTEAMPCGDNHCERTPRTLWPDLVDNKDLRPVDTPSIKGP
jgi:hypothetical protein